MKAPVDALLTLKADVGSGKGRGGVGRPPTTLGGFSLMKAATNLFLGGPHCKENKPPWQLQKQKK